MFSTVRPMAAGVVLFEGFELLDVFGPLEFLGLLGGAVRVSLWGPGQGPVASSSGVRVICDAAIPSTANPDLLLIPGGPGTRSLVHDNKFLGTIRDVADRSSITASVCTGAAILARAGLIDGHRATSNKLAWDWVIAQGPCVQWVRAARWVEHGKFWTSSGISAGMDMMLAMIGRHFGAQERDRVANEAEYLWNSDPSGDPFCVQK